MADIAVVEPLVEVEELAPFVFIVYANRDEKLAEALKQWLHSLGLRAFYCREVRDRGTSQSYRMELAEKLFGADLVLLVLSIEFANSSYCQAEAGATVTMGKRHIQLIIPPVTNQTIHDVSPVLEGFNVVDGGADADIVTRLQEALTAQLASDWLIDKELPPNGRSAEEAVLSALRERIHAYAVEPTVQARIGVWEKLTDKSTRDSIKAHIARAVADGPTDLAIVGVSLKYSINIVTEAIRDLGLTPAGSSRGPLIVQLVHMDHQSGILHSLHDTPDIDSVREFLHERWPSTKREWKASGDVAGVHIEVREPVAIDYIPQQVGVRIESVAGNWSVLYAGRCSFDHAGATPRLLVGECEYLFYTSNSRSRQVDRGPQAIKIFNDYVRQYQQSRHNGATLVPDHYDWISRLESCVSSYHDIRELVLVSNTNQKLSELIVPALRRNIAVKLYTTHPNLLNEVDAVRVRDLENILDKEIFFDIDRNGNNRCTGKLELYHFYRPPTFRAAIIGESVIGLQAYMVRPSRPLTRPDSAAEAMPEFPAGLALVPTDMRLIATRSSQAFGRLDDMVRRFLVIAAADTKPYAVIENARRPNDVQGREGL